MSLQHAIQALTAASIETRASHVPTLVEALLPAWQAGAIDAVEYLAGGYSNLNFAFSYAHRRFVVRIPTSLQPYVDRRREQSWYAILPPGLSVVPEAIDPVTGVMITPWIEGQLLTDAWAGLQTEHLLEYVSNLHRQLPDPGRDYQVSEIYGVQNTSRPRVATDDPRIAPPAPVPEHLRQPCHNDLNPWNVLITPHGWVTLDWEFVGNNDPLFDLVNLHQGLELPLAQLPDLTAAYLDRMGAPPAAPDRLQHVVFCFWYRELRWAQRQLSQGNDRPEIREQVILATQRLSLLQ